MSTGGIYYNLVVLIAPPKHAICGNYTKPYIIRGGLLLRKISDNKESNLNILKSQPCDIVGAKCIQRLAANMTFPNYSTLKL